MYKRVKELNEEIYKLKKKMSELTYIECCEKYKQQIIDRFEPVPKVDKFFTKEEIDELRVYQFKNSKKVKFRETSNYTQN